MNKPPRTRPRLTMQAGRMLSTRAGLPHPVPTRPPSTHRLPTLCPACHRELMEAVAEAGGGPSQVAVYCPHEAALCICTVSEGEALGYELAGPITAGTAEAALAGFKGGWR